ncbi:MAG: hypothetical protein HUU55_14535 [Myxococcales bacterium]|nr:hypothetical protein [Myxococcales bacterium]
MMKTFLGVMLVLCSCVASSDHDGNDVSKDAQMSLDSEDVTLSVSNGVDISQFVDTNKTPFDDEDGAMDTTPIDLDTRDRGDVPTIAGDVGNSSDVPEVRSADDSSDVGAVAASCTLLPPIPSLPISEASGAEFVEIGGQPSLLVVSDSGHSGQFVLFEPKSGQITSGTFPVDDGASDDLEGISVDGLGTVFAITSSGYVRQWRFTSTEDPKLEAVAYPLGDFGNNPAACSPFGINCGKNFEGLCLSKIPLENGCDGYAVSKSEGALYCVTGGNGLPLGIDVSVDPLYVASPDQLSGCAFSNPDYNTVYVTLNVYGSSDLLRVVIGPKGTEMWEKLDVFAGINPEAVAVDTSGVVWVINDTQNLTQNAPISRYQCP